LGPRTGEHNRGITLGTGRARSETRTPVLSACALAPVVALVAATASSSPPLVPAADAGVVGDCTPDASCRPQTRHAAEVLQLVNNHRVTLGRAPFSTSATLTAAAVWKARHISNALTRLSVTYRGSHSAPCDQTIYLWNWSGYWVRFASGLGGPSETGVTFSPTPPSIATSAGDGEVAVRVHCARSDAVGFTSAGDLMKVTFWKPL
jgi:hypothetical protein